MAEIASMWEGSTAPEQPELPEVEFKDAIQLAIERAKEQIRSGGAIWVMGDGDDESQTVAEMTDELDDRLEEAEMREDRRVKWQVADDGLYSLVGHTMRAIPPGFYDIVRSSQGQIFWQEFKPRTDELIRFESAPIDEVVSEIERFWQRQDRFKQYGLPFKRGILLHGPPGSGKSCTLQFVAREMVTRGGYVVQFHDVDLFLAGYRMLRQAQPDAPIVVLMEDLDEILAGRSSSGESRILNLLDGVESTHNVVFLATTNYPEKLGPRIINRPSRFDHRVFVAHPGETARRVYLQSLVEKDDANPFDVEQYVTATDNLSLAHVKELFVAVHILGEDFNETARRLVKMKTKPTGIDDGEDADEWRSGMYK